MGKYQQYEKYKDSGVEWFAELPSEWAATYVGIVSDVIDPQPDHRAPAISQNGEGFPYIGIRDVNKDGTLNFETARPVEESAVLKQEKSFTIEPHNIIFCKVGTLGLPRKIIPHGRCALSATLVLIKVKKLIDSQFLLYVLDSNCITSQTNFLATGSTRAALGIQQIRKFKMPFPTRLEQTQIANFLDHETTKIDTLIDKQQSLIQLLKEKRQAVINNAVIKGLNPDAPMKDSGVEWLGQVPEHWIVSKVKYLTKFQVGWTPSTKNDANFVGKNLWANISDLGEKIIIDTAKRISDRATAEASMDITPKGSLMYSFKLSVGTVSFAGCDMYTNEAIASFIDESLLPLSYLYFALPKFVIMNASTNIYGARILNQELIKNAILLAPDYQEAQKIAEYLEIKTSNIDNLIEKQCQLINLSKERRNALISAAVTGKIDVRGWQVPS